MRQAENHPNRKFIPIVRNSQFIAERRSQGLEVIELDSARSDTKQIRAAIHGLDSIIHLAARTSENNDFEAADLENHQATRKLADASSKEGIVLVTTGSIAQFTRNRYGVIDDGTKPESGSAYGKSKINAHRAAKSFETPETTAQGYKTIQVVPGATIGPDTTWVDYLVKQMQNPTARLFRANA